MAVRGKNNGGQAGGADPTDTGDAEEFKLYTLAELEGAGFSVEYLIDGVLVAGQPMLVAGPSKCLKTSIGADLAVSLTTMTDFLGRFSVTRQIRVVMLSAESGMATLKETFKRVCAARNKTAADAGDRLRVCGDWLPRFYRSEDLTTLGRRLSKTKTELVIVDPAYLCMPGGTAGSVCDNGQLLRDVTRACSDAGAQLVLVHHSKKPIISPSASTVPDLYDAAGAGYAEWARQWILLNRRCAYQPGKNELHLWVGGSAGHGGNYYLDVDESRPAPGELRLWRPTVRTADEGKQEAAAEKAQVQAQVKQVRAGERLKRDMEAITRYLEEHHPEGATKTAIRKAAVADDSARTNAAVSALKARGVIKDCTVMGGNHQQYPGFAMAM